MKIFKYQVVDSAGKTVNGEIEAANRSSAAEDLLSKGYTIVRIEESGGFFNKEALEGMNVGGVPMKEKVVFMRELATMIEAGLPLTQALEILLAQASNVGFKNALEQVLKDVEAGKSLADGLGAQKGIFSEMQVSMIRAGEESGKLIEIINRLAVDMEKSAEFRAKVRGAMIYPVIILVVIVAVVAILMIKMVPAMKDLYSDFDAELPLLTRIIVSISDFTVGYWWIMLIGIVIVTLSGIYYRNTPSGREVTDGILLRLPIFGVFFKKAQAAQMARTLQMLLQSGIPILLSLSITKDALSNVLFKNGIEEARQAVEKGSPLAVPLAKNEIFPVLLSRMVGVGEETGKVDEVLGKIADYYESEVDQMADNLSKMMEPLILVFMGVVVGVIAVAIYYPIFGIVEVIG